MFGREQVSPQARRKFSPLLWIVTHSADNDSRVNLLSLVFSWIRKGFGGFCGTCAVG